MSAAGDIRCWLLLVKDSQALTHLVTLDKSHGPPASGPEDLRVNTVRLDDQPIAMVMNTVWRDGQSVTVERHPKEAARVGLVALDDALHGYAGWSPRRPKVLGLRSMDTAPQVNLVGSSAELALALLAYLSELAHAQQALSAHYPGIATPFAATGEVDELGWVHPVDSVPDKVEAALKALPPGGFVFVPQGSVGDGFIERARDEHGITVRCVARLQEALTALDLPVGGWDPKLGSPYRALEPYRVRHERIYFGREQEAIDFCDQLVAYETDRAKGRARPGALVQAESGQGKSSFVQAGVLARLRRLPQPHYKPMQYAVWQPRLARQDGQEGEALDERAMAHSVARNWRLREEPDATGFVEVMAPFNDALPPTLDELAQAHLERCDPAARYVWVVDQLEELFTLQITDEARQAFAVFLQRLQHQGVWILATMRIEFDDKLTALRVADESYPLAEMFDLRIKRLWPIRPEALGRVIREPARLAGVRFESGGHRVNGQSRPDEPLDTVLVAAAARANSAAGVGHAMHELWLRAMQAHQPGLSSTEPPTMRLADYLEVGGQLGAQGMAGVLGQVGDKALEALEQEHPGAGRNLPALLTALSEPAPAGSKVTETARPAALGGWTEGARGHLVQALVRVGLLAYDLDQDGKRYQVRAAHDALFEHWNAAADYLKESRDVRELIERIRQKYDDWQDSRADAGLLNRPWELELATRALVTLQAHIERWGDDGGALAQVLAYARQSIRTARAKRRLRALVISSVIGTLAAFALFAGRQWQLANQAFHSADVERQNATQRQLRATLSIADKNLSSGFHMMTIAMIRDLVRLAGNVDFGEYRDIALSAILNNREEQTILEHPGSVIQAVSPDGRWMLTENLNSGITSLRNINIAKPPATEVIFDLGKLKFAEFGDGGRNLISIDREGSLFAFSLILDAPMKIEIPAVAKKVRWATVSRNTSDVALCDYATSNLQIGKLIGTFRLTNTGISCLNIDAGLTRFSKDARNIYLIGHPNFQTLGAGENRSLSLLRYVRETNQLVMTGATNLKYPRFAEQGDGLIDAHDMYWKISYWNLDTSSPRKLDLSWNDEVKRSLIAVSPSGRFVAAGTRDGRIFLWNLTPRASTRLQILTFHESTVASVTFSDNEDLLASSSVDGTLALWRIGAQSPIKPDIVARDSKIWTRTWFLNNDARLLSTSIGHAKLWRIDDQGRFSKWIHKGELNVVASTGEGDDPNGGAQVLAAGPSTGGILVWNDWRSGSNYETPLFLDLGKKMDSIALSRDGRHILSSSLDGRTTWLTKLSDGTPKTVRLGLKLATSNIFVPTFSPDARHLCIETTKDFQVLLGKTSDAMSSAEALFQRYEIGKGCAFSNDGKYLVAFSAHSVRVFELLDGKYVKLYSLDTSGRLEDMFFLQHRLAARDWDGNLYVVSREGSTPSLKLVTTSVIGVVAISNEHTLLAFRAEAEPEIWDFSQTPPARRDYLPVGFLTAFAECKSRSCFTTSSLDGRLMLWRINSGRVVGQVLDDHVGPMKDIAIDDQGRRVASLSPSGEVRIWTVRKSGVGSFSWKDSSTIKALQWSEDGGSLVTIDAHQGIRRWIIPQDEEIEDLIAKLQTRCLTASEREAAGLGILGGSDCQLQRARSVKRFRISDLGELVPSAER